MTTKEFDLLACFIEHRGIVLSRERLLDVAWGMTYPGGTRTVDQHVAQLRRKLGGPEAIRTVRGAGYKLGVSMKRARSLRTRLFAAICVIVALAVAITLGLALVLTRRAVEDATLQGSRPPGRADRRRGAERTHAARPPPAARALPGRAARAVHPRPEEASAVGAARAQQGHPVTGSVTLDGTAYWFAAEPVQGARLHPAPPEEPDRDALDAVRRGDRDRGGRRRPARGGRRVLPRPPDHPARRPGRRGEPGPGERPASGARPDRGRGRARDARGLLQRPRRAARAGARGGALVPAVGQPRAEDAADLDRRLCGGAA